MQCLEASEDGDDEDGAVFFAAFGRGTCAGGDSEGAQRLPLSLGEPRPEVFKSASRTLKESVR